VRRALDLPEFILWVKKLSERIENQEEEAQQAWEKDVEEKLPKANTR
jgi:hypothetical protein